MVTRRIASRRNLIKARTAKRTKRFKRKVGAAKRTKVAQQLKKRGITSTIGTVGKVTTTKGTTSILVGRQARGGFQTPRPLSPHFQQDLLFPQRPFGARTEQIRRLQGGYISTAIHSFEYIPDQQALKVTFWKIRIKNDKIVSRTQGNTYIFFGVSNRRYLNFLKASSKGRYFYYNIRGWFKFKRLM